MGNFYEARARAAVRCLARAACMLIIATAAGAADSGIQVSAAPGSGVQVRTADGNYAVGLGGRVQLLYSGIDRDEGRDVSEFRIPRARVIARGHAYRPTFRYYFQGDFNDDFSLRDAYLEAAHFAAAEVRAGQFKIPFNRVQVASSAGLQFVERAILNDEFILGDSGRDIGLQVGGVVLPERLHYAVGLFNGSGPNTSDADSNHLAVGRVLVTPLADFPDYYVEGDLRDDLPARFGAGFALAYLGDERTGRTVKRAGLTDGVAYPGFRGADIVATTADAQFKAAGFSALFDYHFRQIDPRGLAGIEAHGINLQAGYFVLPKTVEIALRFAWIDPQQGRRDDHVREYGVAAGYFLFGHNLKIQADVRRIESEQTDASTENDLAFRLQVQAVL